MPRLRPILLALLVVLGCATYQHLRLVRRHGDAKVRDREITSLPAGAVDHATQVRPILEARCVVCHACYDAPCQLDLGSAEGIDRGGTTAKVYDGTRLLQVDPTRPRRGRRAAQRVWCPAYGRGLLVDERPHRRDLSQHQPARSRPARPQPLRESPRHS
jgi:hypothetical protein